MSQTTEGRDPNELPPNELQASNPAAESPGEELEQSAEQEITLEQLEADISAAEVLHQNLSARLDSIARD